jgi:beta-lactamase regulating signal transducer with metallopeptidase domain
LLRDKHAIYQQRARVGPSRRWSDNWGKIPEKSGFDGRLGGATISVARLLADEQCLVLDDFLRMHSALTSRQLAGNVDNLDACTHVIRIDGFGCEVAPVRNLSQIEKKTLDISDCLSYLASRHSVCLSEREAVGPDVDGEFTMGTILEVGFTNAIMAGLLALGAMLVGRLAKRPALTHGLWLIVLMKLITPPLWSVPLRLPERQVAVVPATEEIVQVIELSENQLATLQTLAEQLPAEAPVPLETIAAKAVEPSFLLRHWPEVVGGAWVMGTLFWMISAYFRIRAFRKVVRLGTPAPDRVQMQSDTIAEKLGLAVSPEVWMTPGTISPLVWAIGGPARLLVPEGLWKTLKHDQHCTLLTHELAHLKRHDHWVRWIELAATAVYWWCPVLWWARHELREAEEQCCDAWVVWAWPKAAKAYATALLETLDFLSETHPAVPLAASGAGHVRHLKRRLTMILSGLTPRSLSFAGKASLLGLSVFLLPLVPTLAQEPKKIDVRVEHRRNPGEVQTITIPGGPLVGGETRSELTTVIVDSTDDDKKVEGKDGDKKNAHQIFTYRVNADDKVGDGPKEVKLNVRFLKKEDAEALEKARAEARELERALDKARARIRELEGKVSAVRAVEGVRLFDAQRPIEIRKEARAIVVEDRDGKKTVRAVRIGPDGTVIEDSAKTGVAGENAPKRFEMRTFAFPGGNLGQEQHEKLMQMQKQLDELQKVLQGLKASQAGDGARVRGELNRSVQEQIEKAHAEARKAHEQAERAHKDALEIKGRVEGEVREKMKKAEAEIRVQLKAEKEKLEKQKEEFRKELDGK